jgi:uncharacterized protein (TIGR03437 family)
MVNLLTLIIFRLNLNAVRDGSRYDEKLSGEVFYSFMKTGIALCLSVAAAFGQVVVSTVAGAGGLGSTLEELHYPGGVAVDGSDNLYIADSYNHRVLKVTPNGQVSTVLGTGVPGLSDSQLRFPRTLAVDRAGAVYVTDSYNHRVQKVAPDGALTSIAGRGGQGGELTQLSYPRGVAVDGDGNVFVSDNYNHRVLKITVEGIITIAAGGRGQGSEPAQLNFPFGIALDREGALYVGDAYNGRVQKVLRDGTASTVAGAGGWGGERDQLANPVGVDIDAAGNLYVSDTNNHRVQRITPGGQVVTIAGGLGAGSGERQLDQPFDTAVDSLGNLYVADTFNHRVQKYTFPAPLAAPQLRHAATNRPGPGSPNQLMRISPALSCPEPIGVMVGGYRAEASSASGETVFTIPEAVDPAVPTEVYVTCQSRSLFAPFPLAMTPLQPRLFVNPANQPLAEVAETGAVVDALTPAKAGSVVSVFGTGFGGLDAVDSNGQRRELGTVTATVGELPVDVLYAGTAPGQTIGLTQINLRISPDVKPGLQPVVVYVDGQPTQGGVVLAVR